VIRRDEQDMQHAYGDEKSVHNFNLKTWKTLETQTMLEDNIKMDLNDMGCERMEWIKLNRNRFQSLTHVDTEVKIQVPRKVDNLLIIRAYISCSRRSLLCLAAWSLPHSRGHAISPVLQFSTIQFMQTRCLQFFASREFLN
jgi:hypothetical protein